MLAKTMTNVSGDYYYIIAAITITAILSGHYIIVSEPSNTFDENMFYVDSENDIERPFNKFLYFIVFVVNLQAFSMGAATAWSSPAITRLNGLVDPTNNPLEEPITTAEEAALASLLLVGAAFGALTSRFLINKIGRKPTLLVAAIPNFFGFLFLTVATDRPELYIGRFLTGISVGVVFAVAPIYIKEIGETNNRKFFGGWLVLSINVGSLFVYAIAPLCTLHTLSMINVFPPVAFAVLFSIWAPETPYHHVSKFEMHKAWNALKKLRYGNEEIVDAELVTIQKEVVRSRPNIRSLRGLLRNKNNWKELLISVGLITLYQFTGVSAIFFYMESIFYEAHATLEADVCTVIVAGVQLIGGLCASLVVAKFESRMALKISALGMTIAQFSLGTYLFLQHYHLEMKYGTTFSIACLSFFVWVSTVGFGPLVVTVAKDLFPPYADYLATTIVILAFLTSGTIVTAVFPVTVESIGMEVTFAIFAVCCGLSSWFVHLLAPARK